MKRQIFYKHVRETPFPSLLIQSQVDGMNAILNEWDQRQLEDTRWLAYILATAYHETAFTMQPVEEYGKGDGRPYGVIDAETGQIYYGRGHVQLTGKANYQKLGDLLGVDLVHHPELALDMEISIQIMFEGMLRGLFTCKKLSRYFDENSDWYNARKIINGLDRAEQIARYARRFYFAILMANGEVQKAMAVPKSIKPVSSPSQRMSSEGVSEKEELMREFGSAISDDEAF